MRAGLPVLPPGLPWEGSRQPEPVQGAFSFTVIGYTDPAARLAPGAGRTAAMTIRGARP